MVWLGLWFHMHGLHGSYIQSNIIYTYFIYDLTPALINHPTPTLPTHQLHRLAIKSLSLSIPLPPCPIAPLLLTPIPPFPPLPSLPHPTPSLLTHLTLPYHTTPSLLKRRTHHPIPSHPFFYRTTIYLPNISNPIQSRSCS